MSDLMDLKHALERAKRSAFLYAVPIGTSTCYGVPQDIFYSLRAAGDAFNDEKLSVIKEAKQ